MKLKYIFKLRCLCVFFLAILFSTVFLSAPSLSAKRPVVIVLDPGHGGSDMGALAKGVMEKELNYRVAMAVKNELMLYEGVEVYVTREGDMDISLRDRAVFAKEHNADLLISLHFNASESHTLSGAETYVSSKSPLRQKAEKFALVELNLLEQYGVPIHGNFTRLNDYNEDYYGIIRESAARQIPAVIVEHCYLDIPEEEQFYDTPDDLERFGKLDATAIAMTYGLKSQILGVDYSKLRKSDQILPDRIYESDLTAPEVTCEFLEYHSNVRRASFRVTVKDAESAVVGYAFSKDGGKSFMTKRELFFEEEFDLECIIKYALPDTFVVAAYNAYGVAGYSEPIDLNAVLFPAISEPEAEVQAEIAEAIHILEDVSVEISEIIPNKPEYIIIFLLFAVMGIITVVILSVLEFRKSRL